MDLKRVCHKFSCGRLFLYMNLADQVRIILFFQAFHHIDNTALRHAFYRFLCIKRNVLRHRHIRELSQIRHIPVCKNIRPAVHMVDSLLMLDHIQSQSTDLPRLDSFDAVINEHHFSSREVAQNAAVLHLVDRLFINHITCLIGQWRVQ